MVCVQKQVSNQGSAIDNLSIDISIFVYTIIKHILIKIVVKRFSIFITFALCIFFSKWAMVLNKDFSASQTRYIWIYWLFCPYCLIVFNYLNFLHFVLSFMVPEKLVSIIIYTFFVFLFLTFMPYILNCQFDPIWSQYDQIRSHVVFLFKRI